jgi:hypothetical protein
VAVRQTIQLYGVSEMSEEVEIVELLPNGLTKVDLRNDERKHFMFEKGVIDELVRRCLEQAETAAHNQTTEKYRK